MFVRPKVPGVISWPGYQTDVPAQQALFTKTLSDAAKQLGVQLEVKAEPLLDRDAVNAYLAHIKNKLRRNLFGDMGIFVRREIFERLDGYAEIPICEEVEFNKRLKKTGKTVILDEVLLSSDRKLLREGPIWAFIKNDIIKCAFALGVSPKTLTRYY